MTKAFLSSPEKDLSDRHESKAEIDDIVYSVLDEICAVGTKSARIRPLLMDGKALLKNDITTTEDGSNCLKRFFS